MEKINEILTKIDDYVWGLPLIIAILSIGVFLSFRVKFLQIFHLHKGFYFMFKKEKGGKGGEISSFAALCTALSATIGTGNIVGVATAVGVLSGGPGALFWMWVSAFFGMAVAYMEGVLAQIFKEKKLQGMMNQM